MRAAMVEEEQEVTKREMDAWRESFLAATISHKSGSVLSQLISRHKQEFDKVRASLPTAARPDPYLIHA